MVRLNVKSLPDKATSDVLHITKHDAVQKSSASACRLCMHQGNLISSCPSLCHNWYKTATLASNIIWLIEAVHVSGSITCCLKQNKYVSALTQFIRTNFSFLCSTSCFQFLKYFTAGHLKYVLWFSGQFTYPQISQERLINLQGYVARLRPLYSLLRAREQPWNW